MNATGMTGQIPGSTRTDYGAPALGHLLWLEMALSQLADALIAAMKFKGGMCIKSGIHALRTHGQTGKTVLDVAACVLTVCSTPGMLNSRLVRSIVHDVASELGNIADEICDEQTGPAVLRFINRIQGCAGLN